MGITITECDSAEQWGYAMQAPSVLHCSIKTICMSVIKMQVTTKTSILGYSTWIVYHVKVSFFLVCTFNKLIIRGVTIRWATIRYISRCTTHDMVHDTIQNQLIYCQWKILKRCGMCHQYCYIKTVILAWKIEFKINKVVYNHPRYLFLTYCVCTQSNKIS